MSHFKILSVKIYIFHNFDQKMTKLDKSGYKGEVIMLCVLWLMSGYIEVLVISNLVIQRTLNIITPIGTAGASKLSGYLEVLVIQRHDIERKYCIHTNLFQQLIKCSRSMTNIICFLLFLLGKAC